VDLDDLCCVSEIGEGIVAEWTCIELRGFNYIISLNASFVMFRDLNSRGSLARRDQLIEGY
jgi:hypothetical protein